MKLINKFKENLYLIIPALCVFFWALYYFIKIGTFISYERYWDFGIYNNAGKRIFTDPSKLYDVSNFYYLPNVAIFFAFGFSIFPLYISYYTFFLLNIIIGIFFVLEFNKVLKFMNLNSKFHRFLFLLIVSNGWFLHRIFTFSQTKLFVGLIIIYIIRREFQIKEENREKDLKYVLINYNILIFGIGMAPSFILILPIYLFHDIRLKEIAKIQNLKIYGTIITSFIIQNFLFILYPSLFFDFLSGYSWGLSHQFGANAYLHTLILPESFNTFYSIFATFFLLIVVSILICNKKLNLEIKIGYFAFAYLYFGMFSGFSLFHILLVFSLLLFVPYVNQEEKFFKFIKKNILLLIVLSFIVAISLLPHISTIFKFFPFTEDFPIIVFTTLRYSLLIFGIGITLSLLILKNKFNKKFKMVNDEEIWRLIVSLIIMGFFIIFQIIILDFLFQYYFSILSPS